jgi:hypothetical protein
MNEELKLWGVLDSSLFSTLTDQQKKEFLTRDANDLLPKLIKTSIFETEEEKEKELSRKYDVSVQYKLMGKGYSHEGTVKAEMLYSGKKGATLISYIVLNKD